MIVNSEAITVLRAVRTLRLFKLGRYWKSFEVLLENLRETLIDIKSFTCLLVIVLYSYTMLGLEFFSYRASFNSSTNEIDFEHGHSPHYNFDTILDSFSTVFTILTNDGQSLIYYNYYRAVSPTLATIYWITFMIFA